ncbi:MAG TPA: DinB family protein [Polyangium sp.]|nr:DinB family protein [Polyangium sp.]
MLTDEQYTTRLGGKASIGEHLRHCVEHFSQLLEGIDSGIIDYDARRRNVILEQSRAVFLSTTRDIAHRLTSFDERDMKRTVTVRMLFTPDTESVDVASTLGRELGFLSTHTIHHLAIIKIIAHSLGASLPDEVGVGHSTMAYRKDCSDSIRQA